MRKTEATSHAALLNRPGAFGRAASALLLWCAIPGTILAVEPIPLIRAEATYHADAVADLASVIDGVETGPSGWTVRGQTSVPQSLVLKCQRQVEAAELTVSLYFLAGRPRNPMAEFSLSFTTDAEPSLGGKWQRLDVLRFSAEVGSLQRTAEGRIRAAPVPLEWTGNERDDVYQVDVRLPGRRATGFRLDAYPVMTGEFKDTPGLSWHEPYDVVVTEFRISEIVRQTTNIALNKPVRASHPLFINQNGEQQQAASLTDGLPSTIAHPHDEHHGRSFFFEIDLGRVAMLDHIGLRNRGDVDSDRLSRMFLELYDGVPESGAKPAWTASHREDGSHPAPGEVDILRVEDGQGNMRGRYLRISSDNPVPLSPQLAEVEVYEARLPEVVMAWADGIEIPVGEALHLPPGVRRLKLQLHIRREGMPHGVQFRWRMRGDLDNWQNSHLMTLDMPCPPAGETIFESQALHSDGQWDAAVYRLPVVAQVFFWEKPAFRWLAGAFGLLSALGLGLFVARRRAKRQLEQLKWETALAAERARIAADLHDDLGAELSSIAMLADLAQQDSPQGGKAASRMNEITSHARQTVRRLEEIVWAVNPANDTVEGFARYFCKFAQDYLELAGVSSRFDLPEVFPGHPLPTLRRHHLFLACKEALHNAVRHGSPSEVNIAMRICGKSLDVIIEDNGRGFDDSPDVAASHGSGNMSRRMKVIDGTFERNSVPGKGTTVKLSIPLEKTAT
jgi:signal transduction histidine kinase